MAGMGGWVATGVEEASQPGSGGPAGWVLPLVLQPAEWGGVPAEALAAAGSAADRSGSVGFWCRGIPQVLSNRYPSDALDTSSGEDGGGDRRRRWFPCRGRLSVCG